MKLMTRKVCILRYSAVKWVYNAYTTNHQKLMLHKQKQQIQRLIEEEVSGFDTHTQPYPAILWNNVCVNKLIKLTHCRHTLPRWVIHQSTQYNSIFTITLKIHHHLNLKLYMRGNEGARDDSQIWCGTQWWQWGSAKGHNTTDPLGFISTSLIPNIKIHSLCVCCLVWQTPHNELKKPRTSRERRIDPCRVVYLDQTCAVLCWMCVCVNCITVTDPN